MFLKMTKCDGTIKARGSADGRPQLIWPRRMQSHQPIPLKPSMFITCAIDAKEKRDVSTIDLPAAFMQTEADEVTVQDVSTKHPRIVI
jgi:hypothetical protein